MRCAVKNCNSGKQPKKTGERPPSFHNLPQNEDQRIIWLQRLDIDLNATRIVICDLHFRPEDIFKQRKSCKWKTYLTKGALPIEPRESFLLDIPEIIKEEPELQLQVDAEETVIKCQICKSPQDLLDTYSPEYNFLQKKLNEITYCRSSRAKIDNWLRFICTCCKEKVDDLWEFKNLYQNAYNQFLAEQMGSTNKNPRIEKVYPLQISNVETQVDPLDANEPLVWAESEELQGNSLKDFKTEMITGEKFSDHLLPQENSQSLVPQMLQESTADAVPVVEETKISLVALPPMIECNESLKDHWYTSISRRNSHPQDKVKEEIVKMQVPVPNSEANNETNAIPENVKPTLSTASKTSRSNTSKDKSKGIRKKKLQKSKEVKEEQKEKRVRRRRPIKRGIFICMLCSKIFHTRNSLNQHVTQVHLKNNRYQCSGCGKEFSTKGKLERHEPIHDANRTTYSCKYCNKTSFTKSPREHLWLVHSIPRKDQDRICICRYCNASLEHRLVYYEHLKTHNLTKYTCRSCPEQCSSLDLLAEHEVTHINTRPYICEICAKTYKDRKSFKHHLHLHRGGEKMYECQFCAKKFTTSYNRKLHMRIHTGETPYECATCLKKFHDRRACAKHSLKCAQKILA